MNTKVQKQTLTQRSLQGQEREIESTQFCARSTEPTSLPALRSKFKCCKILAGHPKDPPLPRLQFYCKRTERENTRSVRASSSSGTDPSGSHYGDTLQRPNAKHREKKCDIYLFQPGGGAKVNREG